MTWNRYKDRYGAGFVTWNGYQGRCRGQGRGRGRLRRRGKGRRGRGDVDQAPGSSQGRICDVEQVPGSSRGRIGTLQVSLRGPGTWQGQDL